MPIDSNGSTLKVTTNVGGKTYVDEDYREAFYNRNQQQEVSHQFVEPLHNRKPVEASEVPKEIVVDAKLQDAIDKDLSKKGIKTNTKTKTKR
tara:strand:+ start:506 stop:781 length:276 start_codon:yes stop_codon:yes gene_type:complete